MCSETWPTGVLWRETSASLIAQFIDHDPYCCFCLLLIHLLLGFEWTRGYFVFTDFWLGWWDQIIRDYWLGNYLSSGLRHIGEYFCVFVTRSYSAITRNSPVASSLTGNYTCILAWVFQNSQLDKYENVTLSTARNQGWDIPFNLRMLSAFSDLITHQAFNVDDAWWLIRWTTKVWCWSDNELSTLKQNISTLKEFQDWTCTIFENWRCNIY